MFEWLDRVELTHSMILPLDPFFRGDLIGRHNGKWATIPRQNWRSMGQTQYYTIGIGTLVMVQPRSQTISFMVRESAWDAASFKFKPDSTSKQTFDERLVYSINKSHRRPENSITPGGIPWELALIADLDAQAAAVYAWRAALV